MKAIPNLYYYICRSFNSEHLEDTFEKNLDENNGVLTGNLSVSGDGKAGGILTQKPQKIFQRHQRQGQIAHYRHQIEELVKKADEERLRELRKMFEPLK